MATITTLVVPLSYAAYHQFWHFYGTMLFMLMTGLVYHATNNSITLRMDHAAILQCAYMSYLEGSQLGLLWLAYYGFTYAGIVYGIGYYTERMAFSPSYLESRIYHGIIHVQLSLAVTYSVYVKSRQLEE